MSKTIKTEKTNEGYAVLELIFYVTLFAVISLVIINAMIIMTTSFKETTIQTEFMQGGAIMEKISREIRQAHDIDPTSSSVDLKLNTKDELGNDKTVEFLLSGTDINFFENSVLTGNLNAPNIVVLATTFTQITTAKSKAVKIILSVRSNHDSLGRTFDFYDTVVLRGGY